MTGLRFLGTSAGELYPGIWCRCRNCEASRRAGGSSLRQSACALLGDLSPQGETPDGTAPLLRAETLIDFPPEIVSQGWKWGVDFSRLTTLLMTHSHGDHFLPYLLRWRGRPRVLSPEPPTDTGGPRFTELPPLAVYGNRAVEDRLLSELGANLNDYDLEFVRVTPFQPFDAGAWKALPVAANHDRGKEDAVNYVLQGEGLTLYYGLDSDFPLPETWEALSGFRYDAMIFESTYGFGDGGNHMNFERLIRAVERIREAGWLNPGGSVIATHFSPHHCPPHPETAEYLGRFGILAAFDGMDWSLSR
jgi:phosphoribosyl 1,2-cyclic phosphate phosphodiesterase